MKLTGKICEVGTLEQFGDEIGFVFQGPDGRLITVIGLTQQEIRDRKGSWFGPEAIVNLTVGATP